MRDQLGNTKYGEFETVIGVPKDYDDHRCQYAREYIDEQIGGNLTDRWVIQTTIPVEPVGEPNDGYDYYKFSGNVKMDIRGDAE